MSVCFYPKHEFARPSLRHCPHLGGMALGTLAVIANRSDQSFESSRLPVLRGCARVRRSWLQVPPSSSCGFLECVRNSPEKRWLEQRLEYLSTCDVTHEKAITLQGRLLRHYSEWLVFVYDERVPPTNNLTERALRPLVVMRKITFGSSSSAGAKRLGVLMTLAETARRHGSKPSDVYYWLFTRSPPIVLRDMCAGR